MCRGFHCPSYVLQKSSHGRATSNVSGSHRANLILDTKKRLTTMLQNLTTLYLPAFTERNTSIHFVSSSILEQLGGGWWWLIKRSILLHLPCLEDIKFWSVGCSESCIYSSQAIAPPLRRRGIRFEPDPLDNIMDWFVTAILNQVPIH